jgi:ketosteroid isomerase-like protein
MSRRASITLIARPLLFSVLVLLAGHAKSYAQESDIRAAINAYHAAIGSLDMSKMDPLWAHDAGVMLITPQSKSISVGWDAVKKVWESNTFSVWSELNVTQMDGPYIQIKGDMAWATGVAKAAGKLKTGNLVNAATFEMDVFEKSNGRWLLVSHTDLRVPQ